MVENAMEESPIAVLEGWEQSGGIWRLRRMDTTGAVVDLCACHGETVDELRSSDPALLRYLAGRSRSDPID
jgi:hypothetical protein